MDAQRLFRGAVVGLSRSAPFQTLVTKTAPGRAVAERFVAGETLADGIWTARQLHDEGLRSMLDHLGENVERPEQINTARNDYLSALARIAEEPALDCAVSVKLSQLGLEPGVPAAVETATANLWRIVEQAEASGALVAIDMEDHRFVDDTLAIHRSISERYPRVAVCLQAQLLRTASDIFNLPPASRVRLVKGAYLEPSHLVHQHPKQTRQAFASIFTTLMEGGHSVDIGTHDPVLIDGAAAYIASEPSRAQRVEFQMLYGVRRDLQVSLADQGLPVRIYVPYGSQWYPYLTRRLAERPANMWFFASNLLGWKR